MCSTQSARRLDCLEQVHDRTGKAPGAEAVMGNKGEPSVPLKDIQRERVQAITRRLAALRGVGVVRI